MYINPFCVLSGGTACGADSRIVSCNSQVCASPTPSIYRVNDCGFYILSYTHKYILFSRGCQLHVFSGERHTAPSACQDTNNWANYAGQTCDSYALQPWCANGDFLPGAEWSGRAAGPGIFR